MPALLLSLLLMGCSQDEQEEGVHAEFQLFDLLPSEKTSISFVNEVVETEDLNVMQYEYLYNGAGVAIGDVNGDNLPDIYLTGNSVENKLYINKGNFKFEDVTVVSGVGGKNGWKTGTSMSDVNGDGLLDIYVCYSGLGSQKDRSNQLFINQGPNSKGVPTFLDKAMEYGIDAIGTYSTQAVFFDYDLDGDLDMFLLNQAANFYNPFYNSTKLRNKRHPYYGNSLFRNDNGKFQNVSDTAGIHGSGLNFGLGVAISDFNEDDLPDIYVSNDYSEQDFLYLNDGDGTFHEASKESFGHISQASMGNDAADMNNDGHIDLITLDMLPEDNYRQKILKGPDGYDRYHLAIDSGYHKQQMRNMFQLNRGVDKNGIPRFSEIGQLAGMSNTDWSWAALAADFDGDGRKDLFITNGYLRDYTNMDFMKFEVDDATDKVRGLGGGELFGKEGKQKYSNIIFELVKKMPSTKISNYMLKNENGLTFKNVSKAWGLSNPSISTGAAYADLDNDGDLDLVISNTNEPVGVYRNNLEKAQHHYLKIQLKGDNRNSFGIGSKIWVTTDSSTQFVEHYTVRGYQSSIDPVITFGLGTSQVANVKVQWPDGKISTQDKIQADKLIQFDQREAKMPSTKESSVELKELFENVSNSGIAFKHKENNYIDIKVNRLALLETSKSGPKMSVADVNGDHLDDVFIGGAFGQVDALFLSKSDGKFRRSVDACWNLTSPYETIGSVFFDVDNDGDMDLYVVNGGSEHSTDYQKLKDRLYINDGTGQFTEASGSALPGAFSNGSVVAAGDYDNDGDADLFVGGGAEPGNYPMAALGGILRNDTDHSTQNIRFSIVTNEVNPELRQPGIIKDAIWEDINNDEWLDLVLIGEWMPMRIFINEQGKLMEKTAEYGLSDTYGFWQSVGVGDMDGDGDTDLIVGNMGDNLPFKVSESEPLEAYVGDFRGDGVLIPVISCYIQNKRYPIATFDQLQDAIPLMKKRFLKHEQYAASTLDEVFSKEQLRSANHFKINQLKSLYLENKGGFFEQHELPIEAQYSAVQGITIDDFTGDGVSDVLLTGNYYPFRAEIGPSDAGKGVLLEGYGKGQFKAIRNDELGLWVEGDVRDTKILNHEKQKYILVSKNNDRTELLRILSTK